MARRKRNSLQRDLALLRTIPNRVAHRWTALIAQGWRWRLLLALADAGLDRRARIDRAVMVRALRALCEYLERRELRDFRDCNYED